MSALLTLSYLVTIAVEVLVPLLLGIWIIFRLRPRPAEAPGPVPPSS